MSFILEALRKSEAARRRSEAPDLFSAMHDAPAPARERRQAPVWIVGVVGVLSLGVATWLVLQREPAPTHAVSIDSAPQARTVDAPDTAPVANANAPAATQAASPASPAKASPSATPPVAAPPPSPAAIATTPVAAPPASLPEPPPAPRPSSDGRPMALSELDAGSRKQLPALKMSMHMWNEDAGRRFVIVDGQRLGEGDLIGDAQVESITRDGVVLNWQGARLQIDTR